MASPLIASDLWECCWGVTPAYNPTLSALKLLRLVDWETIVEGLWLQNNQGNIRTHEETCNGGTCTLPRLYCTLTNSGPAADQASREFYARLRLLFPSASLPVGASQLDVGAWAAACRLYTGLHLAPIYFS